MNKIAAKTIAVCWVASKNFEAISIKPVQAIFGANPNKTLFILCTTDGSVVRQAILNLVVPEVIRLGLCNTKLYDKHYQY